MLSSNASETNDDLRLSELGRRASKASRGEKTKGKIEYFTLDEELFLGRMMRLAREDPSKINVTRAERAKRCLAQSNIRLVYKKANAEWRHNPYGTTQEDLIGAGRIGLARALQGYDDRKGFKFSTYAIWWVRHYIQRWGHKISHPASIPEGRSYALASIKSEIKSLESDGRPATTSEINEILERRGVTRDELTKMESFSRSAYSLDAPVFSDSGVTTGDIIKDDDVRDGFNGGLMADPEDEAMKSDVISAFSRMIDELPPIQRALVGMMYVDDRPMGPHGEIKLTKAAVRRRLGISKSDADRELHEALATLRGKMLAHGYGPATIS